MELFVNSIVYSDEGVDLHEKCKLILLCIALMLAATGCIDEPVAEKPVIYLYPEETMEVTVRLNYNGELSALIPNMMKADRNCAPGRNVNQQERREGVFLPVLGRQKRC